MKYRLLIADDHTLFNEGVKQLIADKYDIAGQIFDGRNVVAAVQTTRPDIILLDINLPTINGFDLVKEIRKSSVIPKIIFLSMYTEKKFIEQAKLLGVDGYMLKHSTKEELIESIETVMSGRQHFDPKLDRSRKNLHQEDYFVKRFSLTPREIEIIGLIRNGKDTPHIAEALFLAVDTVKTHRKNIYYKLGITKSTELIKFAIENNI